MTVEQATPPIVRSSGTSKLVSPALILAVLSIASFLAQLDVWITNVGLPAIGSGVHADSLSNLSWVLNGYAIIYAALLVPAGRLTDRFGRKGGFLLGLSLFGVASLGAGLSGDIWVLVGFRALQAVGAALLTPASLGLVLTSAPPEKVVKYVKIWFTSGALSAAMGPVLGGLLVQASWRWLFLINIPVVVAAVVLAVKLVPNSRHEQDARFPDILGGVVLIVAVGALALALVEAPSWGWSSARVIIAFAVSALSLATFVRRSARHPVPVVELGLFKDRIFTAANLGAMLAFAAFGILLLSTILWLQGHWGYSAIKTGFASAPGPVLFAAFAAVAETLQQRYRLRPGSIAAVGTVIASVGALLFIFLLHDEPSYVTGFLPRWVLIGIGFGLTIPTTVSAATVDLRPEQAATGSAIVSMSMQIGSVLGISILVALLGTASGGASLNVFRHAWLLSVPIAALGIITAFGINPKRAGAPADEPALVPELEKAAA